MSCSHRHPPGTHTASHSATAVLRVHVGWGTQHSSAAAYAQHRGGPGGCRAHSEGWRHTLWAPHPVGGEQAAVGLEYAEGVPSGRGCPGSTPSPASSAGPAPRCGRGRPPSWGRGAAAAPVHLAFPGGPVRRDHQARGLWGPLYSLPDWLVESRHDPVGTLLSEGPPGQLPSLPATYKLLD